MDADLSNSARHGAPGDRVVVTVHINGEPRETRAATLAALVDEGGYGEARIATAVNGNFVPARMRAATPLAADDRIEIVAPRQGG